MRKAIPAEISTGRRLRLEDQRTVEAGVQIEPGGEARPS